MSRKLRLTFGVAIWIILIVAAVYGARRYESERFNAVTSELVAQATGRRQHVFMYMDYSMQVGVGDPVFVVEPNGRYRQVGEVSAIPARTRLKFGTADSVRTGELLLYADVPPLSEESRLTLHHTPESMEWVLQTMLPPDKQERIALLISRAFEAHQEEIIASLQPIIEDGFREALLIVEQDLEVALLSRSDELERIGAKYQTELVQEEIVPLVRSEIFPIVRYYGEPLAENVGRKMWDRASLWRFGWRYMYDISPLPQRDLARKEWQRFVDEDAVPVLEENLDEFIEMQQDVFRDVAKNKQVQDVVRRSLRQIVQDAEVQQVVMSILREVLLENPRLRDALHRHWTSPRARQALSIASQRFEPTAVEIGELLFGNPQTGITPEFARVLRNQVLKKDRRWLVLHPQSAQDGGHPGHVVMRVELGETQEENPFTLLWEEDE